MNRHILRPLLALALGMGACRQDDAATSPQAPAKPTQQPPAAPPSPATEEVATAPITVSGAYLAQCSAETEKSYVDDAELAYDLTACRLTDESGAVIEATVDAVKVVVLGETLIPELVPKTKADSKWAVGFKIDAGKIAEAQAIEIAFKTKNAQGDAASATATAPDANFDWRSDPDFAAVIAAGRKLYALFKPDLTGFDGIGGIAGCEAEPDPHCHILFFSSSLHTGDVTVEGADAICAELGAKIPLLVPKKSWRAFLSTSTASAISRLPERGKLFGVNGSYEGYLARPPVAPQFGRIRFDEAGHTPYTVTLPPSIPAMEIFWTGSTPEGVFSPEDGGACGDWTSAERTATGAITVSLDLKGHKRRCSDRAHLMCFGLGEP